LITPQYFVVLTTLTKQKMNNRIFIGGLIGAFILASASSCSSQKNTVNREQQVSQQEVTGTITAIENGKDGYMATVKDKKGTISIVTISVVNLQKSGGTFKRYNIGDMIQAKGEFWKDQDGIMHITAQSITEIK